jgi:hypothetical protein
MEEAMVLWLVLMMGVAQASVQTVEVASYAEIMKSEKAAPDDVGETLWVFDIDETLLVVENCLGKNNSDYMGWIETASTCPAHLTEEEVDEDLKKIQAQGYDTIALTGRGDNLKKATKRELKRNGLEFSGHPFTRKDNFKKPISNKSDLVFDGGVAYSSGKNKGEALRWVLDKLPRDYSRVIFVDDGVLNVQHLEEAFADEARVQLKIYHYTRYN